MKDASSDPAVVTAMFTAFPGANIGAQCAQSGFLVIDVDPRNGGDVTLQKLVAEHGDEFTNTIASDTGGGDHYFLANAGGKWAGRLGEWIDVKTNGYVIPRMSRVQSNSVTRRQPVAGDRP